MPKLKHLHGLALVCLGCITYYVGRWWDNYTFTHGHGSAIDFNFGAALVSMVGFLIAIAGLILFLIGFRKSDRQ